MYYQLWRRGRLPRLRLAARRLAVPALVISGTVAGLGAAAASAATPLVAVKGSSVIAANWPLGPATVTASRPDPLTGRPVVIGRYAGAAVSWQPLTVNTTTPIANNPAGDCWQQGALASPLTPDLLPGDTVTVTSGADTPAGVPPLSMSITVPADAQPSVGPIPGCDTLAPFARSTITDAPKSVTGGPITVRGLAQPLATDVSITAVDGAQAKATASATPGADGTWSVTLPAEAVGALADGSLTLTPVFAVPDVGTGATAHVAAAPVTVQKAAAGADTGGSGAGVATSESADAGAGGTGGAADTSIALAPDSRAPGAPGAGTGAWPVTGLRLPARLSLRSARARGISASFLAPAGASTVELQLLRGGTALYSTTVAARPGARQTVRLSSPSVRRLLRPGRYTLRVRAGSSRDQLGSPQVGGLVVR